MGFSGAFFLFVFMFCVVSEAQRCDPGLVENVTFLDSQNLLRWSKVSNRNNCILRGYVIDIKDVDNQNDEFQIRVDLNTTSYNFDFLDKCSTYVFEIRVLTNEHLLGPPNQVNVTTKPSARMNLSLTLSSFDNAQLNWSVSDYLVNKCVSYYRVVYWDNDNNHPTDIYVNAKNFSIPNAGSCAVYKVRVSAIVDNPDAEGPVAETVVYGRALAPEVPQLVNLTTTARSVTMWWKLPTYQENRCRLTELKVLTAGVALNSTVIKIPIVDSPLRLDVNVSIDGLSSDSAYQSFVSLWNVAGSSRNVSVSYQTTDY